MKKTNKILSIILAILMVISIMPITASAAAPTSGTCGENVTWEYDEVTESLTISGEGPMYGYQVDDYIDERPWITYDRCFELERVVINEGVTCVSYNSFVNCFKLSYVTLPASVTYIDENAFDADSPILVVHYLGTEEEWNNVTICSGNEALLNAKIYCGDYKPTSASGTCGENLTWAFDADTFTLTISGTGAMDDFYTDYFIDFRDPMDYIYEGNRPWEDYKYEIQKVVVSDGVTAIGNNAFRLFVSLKDVEISNSVTKINYRALYHCDNLTDIYYSGTEEEWNSITKGTIENVSIHYNYHTHDYETVVTAPTCTEQGYTTYTCGCGDTYVDGYVDALGHTPAEPVQKWPANPTCTENGSIYEFVYCSECDEEISSELVVIEATRHKDADNDGYCDNCEEQLCNHRCHKIGFAGFLWKIINFFNKLFGLNNVCDCGVAHY